MWKTCQGCSVPGSWEKLPGMTLPHTTARLAYNTTTHRRNGFLTPFWVHKVGMCPVTSTWYPRARYCAVSSRGIRYALQNMCFLVLSRWRRPQPMFCAVGEWTCIISQLSTTMLPSNTQNLVTRPVEASLGSCARGRHIYCKRVLESVILNEIQTSPSLTPVYLQTG